MENTIYDVARLAGVSTATVSRVMNKTEAVSPSTEAKVIEAMDKLNYTPSALAQGFASNKSRTIGLVMNFAQDSPFPESTVQTMSDFFIEMFRGVNSIIRKKDYYLMIINEEKDLQKVVKSFLDKRRLDGMIFTFTPFNISSLKEVIAKERPLVYVGNIKGYNRGLHVYSRYTEYFYDIVMFLKNKGHKRIALVTARDEDFFVEDWKSSGKPGLNDLDLSFLKYSNMEKIIEDVKSLFLRVDRPTAFFVQDLKAVQLSISIFSEMGLRVPEDVSIVSLEYTKGAGESFFPKITNVYVPVYDMGVQAVTILLNYLEGKTKGYNKLVEVEPVLIERDSVIDLNT
ncbi:MAG: LacI family DNA-binding transcriptional regulator [Spirochaetales bacterium]|nr:LacI family DNA-binding transcriptional regulator [Spirochaetales bacterium]